MGSLIPRATGQAPRMLRLLISAAFLLVVASSSQSREAEELIRDPHFQNGLILLDPNPGKKVPYGTLGGPGAGSQPIWDLAQWASKYPLQNDPQWAPDGFANEGKAVLIGPPGSESADLCLAVAGSAEYGTRVRQKGEDWVHLLVEQRIQNRRPLDQMAKARLHLEARLRKSKKNPMPGYSRDLHAAHFQVFFTIQNCNKSAPDYRRYVWFGIPIYDDRHRLSPAYAARDGGKKDATGMFIYKPAGTVFAPTSTHDGQWVTIDRDILPLIQQGLDAAFQNGFLKDPRSLSDYSITSINVGWEVSGIFDVDLQVRNLSLLVTPR